jgi:phenylalanyl-tRNA synthetase beta chain
MKITVEWLKEFVETEATPAEIGKELTMLGLELEAVEESALGPVLDFKVTPNRGDCLSVFGLARELAAKDSQKYRPTEHFRRAVSGFAPARNDSAPSASGSQPSASGSQPSASGSQPSASGSQPSASGSQPSASGSQLTGNGPPLVEIESPELCRRYVGAVMRDVKVGASPDKIAQRLTACGMRPIDSIVDTTNYVMLELGQPLHAFDLRQLRGARVVVRTARSGETMKTLDGQARKLTAEMLMICDAERPVAIAGVMGGENSEVARDTTEILLESAHFDPVSIRRTRKALRISTEASYRFERFVDPELCLSAAWRVAELLGATVSDLADIYPGKVAREAVLVRESRWNGLLGMEIPKASAAAILVGLGCAVTETEDGLSVIPPPWRNDIQIEEDLVEEIGRMWGYEKIPSTLPHGSTTGGGYGREADFRKRIKAAMLRLGFTETLTHTLSCPSPLSAGDEVAIRHAASPDLSTLRSSILPGLAQAISKNRGRSLALFEVGRIFVEGRERRSIAMMLSGNVHAAHWTGGPPAQHDFYSLKGVVEEFGLLLGRTMSFSPLSDCRFQASKCAAVTIGGEACGMLGEVGAAICEKLDLPVGTLAAEIDIDTLMAQPSNQIEYRALSPFPAIRRDFAILMPKSVGFDSIERALTAAAEGLAERVSLFDVFEGKGIEPGIRSLGISVTLRAANRTLTDEEASAFSERALGALEGLGGVLRS